jgi:putative oxidoreductase
MRWKEFKDVSYLLLRGTTGALLAGHGAQKLFGAFGGYGIEGTAGWLESLGLRPGKVWAYAAGLSEFGGGTLMMLGFLNPLGPLGVIGSMGMAIAKVHPLIPIWVTSGGAELPVTNIAIASALMLSGPGKYSLDYALDTRLPRWVIVPGVAFALGGIAVGALASRDMPEQQERESGGQLQAEGTESAE